MGAQRRKLMASLAVIFAVGVFLMAISYRIVMRQQVAA